MKKKVLFPSIILAVILFYGLFRLFAIRFAGGDVYSPYSSLRTDGLGTKALHDSLAELMPVERNLQPIAKIAPDNATTMFIVGISPREFQSSSEMDDLKALVNGGYRLVLTFLPVREGSEETSTPSPTPEKKIHNKDEKSKGHEDAGEGDEDKTTGWLKPWEVKERIFKHEPQNATAATSGAEPRTSWHTALYFESGGASWKTLYTALGKPVVIERTFGRGSIVMVADSYLLSNEALGKERAPGFLSMLVGSARRVVFEETHLGISENPGMATLVRNYHLQGVVIALLIVVALFVWRNAIPFVPAEESHAGRQDVIEGRDASAGFVSLLKRNIPPRELIATCVAEWKRSSGRRVKPADAANVEILSTAGGKQPVQTFQAIAQFLNQKK
ncbi:MAG: DUF4350 domain-containing protein [Chthoniobacteraceae bacterium]